MSGRKKFSYETVYHISKILHTHTYICTQTLPVAILSSVLNSSAVRLEKLSSSKGFHAGCEGVLVAPPDARTVGPGLLWSWPESPTPSWTGWAVLGGDVSDLQVKNHTKYHE